jgi:hypothetical protein
MQNVLVSLNSISYAEESEDQISNRTASSKHQKNPERPIKDSNIWNKQLMVSSSQKSTLNIADPESSYESDSHEIPTSLSSFSPTPPSSKPFKTPHIDSSTTPTSPHHHSQMMHQEVWRTYWCNKKRPEQYVPAYYNIIHPPLIVLIFLVFNKSVDLLDSEVSFDHFEDSVSF